MKLRLAAAGAPAGGALARWPGGARESRDATAGFCSNVPRGRYATLERAEAAGDWFEAYRVAPRVYAIYEPFQFQEVISCLIPGDEAALLFDTGMGIGRIRAVVDDLTAHNTPVAQPSRLLELNDAASAMFEGIAAGNRLQDGGAEWPDQL